MFKKLKRVKRVLALVLINLIVLSNLAQAADSEYTWKSFTNTNNIRGAIYIDGTNIYIGTEGGLLISRDNGASWITKTVSDGLPHNYVKAVYASGSSIYVATNGGGICISKDSGNTWITKTTANGLLHNQIYGLAVDGSRIYAASPSNGVSVFEDSYPVFSLVKNITTSTTTGLISNSVRDIRVSGQNIYLATASGLAISTDGGNNWISKSQTDGMLVNSIASIFIDDNYVYLGTEYGGLSIFENNASGNFPFVASKTTTDGLAHSYIKDIYVSGQNIYLATMGGLSISNNGGSTWQNKNSSHGLAASNMESVFSVGSKIYVGSYLGLSVSDDGGQTWSIPAISNGLGSNVIYNVYALGENIYAVTEGGLSISNNGGASWVNKTMTNGLGSNNVKDVHVVGSNIYAATQGGVSISTDGGNSWINKTTANGLGNNNVQGIYAVGTTIYAATQGGLSISTDGGVSWVNKTTSDGLVNNNVYDVYVLESTIYAATDGGLSISYNNGNTWINKTTENGLGGNRIKSISVSNGNIYAALSSGTGGLAISQDNGTSWVNKSIQDGLIFYILNGVYSSGDNVYVTTTMGLSISTDKGATWKNKTSADGLADNYLYGVYADGANVYLATGRGFSVGILKGGGSNTSPALNIFSYLFNRASAADVSYKSQRNGVDVAKIQLSETMLGLGQLVTANFSDVVIESKDGGKPYINVPTDNPVAIAVNNDTTNNMVVTASFYDLPKDKFPVIMMNGIQITDLNGNVFPAYTGYVKNIDWNNTTGTLTFEITHFTEYGVPALSGKTFSGTGAATAINAAGTNLALNVQNYSVAGTAALDTSRTVQKISGLSYETVLTDVTNNANYLYQAMVPGETYGISFEYINRGNASDTIDLSATLERQNTDNFNIESGANSVNYTDSKSIAAWQVASFNILINANDAYSLDVATLNVDVLVNGAATVSYNAFANAYAATFDSDRAYGGDNFNYVIILKAEGYDLQLLDRVISVNAPVGYTGDAISVDEIVPGTKIDYAIVIKNNSLSDAVSVNIKDIIPGNCHLYYVEGETPTVNGALVWEWKGATENVAPADDAIWYEITIPGQSVVTASYSVTLD